MAKSRIITSFVGFALVAPAAALVIGAPTASADLGYYVEPYNDPAPMQVSAQGIVRGADMAVDKRDPAVSASPSNPRPFSAIIRTMDKSFCYDGTAGVNANEFCDDRGEG